MRNKGTMNGIEFEVGSGNVFADLGLPDAEKLKIKSDLVVEIARAMRRLPLTQKAAAERMGIPQPRVSAMLGGNFSNPSPSPLIRACPTTGSDRGSLRDHDLTLFAGFHSLPSYQRSCSTSRPIAVATFSSVALRGCLTRSICAYAA